MWVKSIVFKYMLECRIYINKNMKNIEDKIINLLLIHFIKWMYIYVY